MVKWTDDEHHQSINDQFGKGENLRLTKSTNWTSNSDIKWALLDWIRRRGRNNKSPNFLFRPSDRVSVEQQGEGRGRERDTELTSLPAVGTRGVNKWNSTSSALLSSNRQHVRTWSFGRPIVPLYKNIREMVRENNACSSWSGNAF